MLNIFRLQLYMYNNSFSNTNKTLSKYNYQCKSKCLWFIRNYYFTLETEEKHTLWVSLALSPAFRSLFLLLGCLPSALI